MINLMNVEEELMKRMMYYFNYYNYQLFYFIERILFFQFFSDENFNVCCIFQLK